MADSTVPPSSDWKQVRRAFRTARFAPIVTLRRGGVMALSADFVRVADIARCSHVSLFLSVDGLRLGMSFHNNEADDNAFLVVRDGGAGRVKDTMNRMVTAKALLLQSPALAALTKEEATVRRFEPRRDGNFWVINLAPCFELVMDGAVSATATGIYRYRLGDDTVYIGRGCLRDRFASPDRRDWQFDRIEYSVINDDAAERRWETFWLNHYRAKHSRWPVYNKISGIELPKASAG